MGTESFITFDLESTWSAAVLTMVADVVDPSLLVGCHESRDIAYSVLDEMFSRGNLVAGSCKDELAILEQYLAKLDSDVTYPARAIHVPEVGSSNAMSLTDEETIDDWLFENGISGEQLNEVADSLNLDGLEWLTSGSLNDIDATFL